MASSENMKTITIFLIVLFSSNCLAAPELIIECNSYETEAETSPVTYILDTKKGIAEVLYRSGMYEGIVGTSDHFYTLYFTRNKKSKNAVVRKIVVNRITAEFTQTDTSNSSYPNNLGRTITGTCKKNAYERKL